MMVAKLVPLRRTYLNGAALASSGVAFARARPHIVVDKTVPSGSGYATGAAAAPADLAARPARQSRLS
jgi:hypothetical protein